MLENIIPEKEGELKSPFIQDPMKAAMIMLYVWQQYSLKLSGGELSRICTSLCLPKLPKEGFLQYWRDFSHDVSSLKKYVHL